MFDVFLSYSRRDQAAVEALAEALRSAGIRPFLDRWHLLAGRPWQEALAEKLKGAQSVAVCLGAGEMGSWQKREMQFALVCFKPDRHGRVREPVRPSDRSVQPGTPLGRRARD